MSFELAHDDPADEYLIAVSIIALVMAIAAMSERGAKRQFWR